jgi:predicted enzyme related to lactoylglutathione lyase
MNKGIKTIIYPVKDLRRAKTSFSKLLGVEPYTDNPYYVGFRIGDQEIGLDPNFHKDGMTAYYIVDDIIKSKQSLLDEGAQIIQDIKDVGRGRLIASLRDSDGNIIGFIQEAETENI